jgi:WD40 repeat protein
VFLYRVLCICGNSTHLATGSLDRTIIIWLLKDGKLYQTLTGHTKGVWALKFLSATLLISGAYDATIKVGYRGEYGKKKNTISFFYRFGMLIRVFVYEHSCHTKVQYGH